MDCKKKQRRTRIVISLFIGVIFTLVFTNYDNDFTFKEIGIKWIVNTLITYVLWEGNAQIYDWLDEKIAWDKIKKRLIVQSTLSLVLTATVVFGIVPLGLIYAFNEDYPDYGVLVPSFIITMLVTIMITAINAGNDFLRQWKKSMQEQEALKRKFVEAQYQALRSQVNPHFLFNSFNTLNALILESSDKSRLFVNELASFYRKVLAQPNSEILPLAEELALLKNYIYLLKTRYEDDFEVNFNVNTSAANYLIPHMSLQLCLENALKHNKVSSKHKLIVNINQKEEVIEIENKISAKQLLAHESSGLGLKQINAVYKNNQIHNFSYNAHNQSFIVKLPLIPVKND